MPKYFCKEVNYDVFHVCWPHRIDIAMLPNGSTFDEISETWAHFLAISSSVIAFHKHQFRQVDVTHDIPICAGSIFLIVDAIAPQMLGDFLVNGTPAIGCPRVRGVVVWIEPWPGSRSVDLLVSTAIEAPDLVLEAIGFTRDAGWVKPPRRCWGLGP